MVGLPVVRRPYGRKPHGAASPLLCRSVPAGWPLLIVEVAVEGRGADREVGCELRNRGSSGTFRTGDSHLRRGQRSWAAPDPPLPTCRFETRPSAFTNEVSLQRRDSVEDDEGEPTGRPGRVDGLGEPPAPDAPRIQRLHELEHVRDGAGDAVEFRHQEQRLVGGGQTPERGDMAAVGATAPAEDGETGKVFAYRLGGTHEERQVARVQLLCRV